MEKGPGSLSNGIEMAIKYGGSIQDNKASNQNSLFGGTSESNVPEPKLPMIEEWNPIEKLNREKEVAGMFISGHPLDDYKLDLDLFTNTKISDLANINSLKGKEMKLAGMVTSFEERITKTGKPWAKFVLEDFSGAKDFALFGEDFTKFRSFLQVNAMIYALGGTQNRYGNPDDLEFKFSKISFLADLRNAMLKTVQLQLKPGHLNKDVLEKLKKVTANNKGPATLKITLYDPESKYQTDLMSRQLKIDWNPLMVKELEMMDIGYKIN
jgi:DNA polymerase-3 subunit alpha